MTLNLDQFTSLYKSCERLYAREKTTKAWIAMVAAQSTQKEMKKILAPFTEASTTPEERAADDRAKLRSRLGR